jgi:non-specific serine/threonine protein kinase
LRGHVAEGRAWQAELGVESARVQPTATWARALTQTGILHAVHGAVDLALDCFAAAAPVARAVGDDETVLRTLNNIAELLRGRGDYVRAATVLDDALATSRRSGDRVRESLTLANLAALSLARGDLDAASAQTTHGLHIASALHDAVQEATHQRILGTIALTRGDHREAQRRYDASLELARGTSHPIATTSALVGLGHAAYAAGQPKRAQALFREALGRATELGLDAECAAALTGLAALAADAGQLAEAVRFDAAAARLRERGGIERPVGLTLAATRAIARARRLAGVGPTSTAPAEPPEATAAMALAFDPPQARVGRDGPLTARELDVARLIGESLTNRQIAQRLVISRRTVATHVEHILAKLHLRSRLEIGLWVAARLRPT